jgi:hypothetical protein
MGMNQRFETLWDVTRRDANLHVQCSFHCANESVVDAKRLERWYRMHLWDTHMSRLSMHLRCSKCLGRPERIKVTHQTPNGPRWGPQSEKDWVLVVRRLRG